MIASLLLVTAASAPIADADMMGTWSGRYRVNDVSHHFKGLNIPPKGPRPQRVGGILFTLTLFAGENFTLKMENSLKTSVSSGTWKRINSDIFLRSSMDGERVRRITRAGDGKSLSWLEPIPAGFGGAHATNLKPGALVELFRS